MFEAILGGPFNGLGGASAQSVVEVPILFYVFCQESKQDQTTMRKPEHLKKVTTHLVKSRESLIKLCEPLLTV